MKLYIAADHRGVKLRDQLLMHYNNMEVETSSLENHPLDDYVDFAIEIGNLVAKEKDSLGILICGSGIGMSIAANKVKNVLCALVHNEVEAEKARKEDGANIISLPASLSLEECISIIDTFIKTPALIEEKYVRRAKKVLDYENDTYYQNWSIK